MELSSLSALLLFHLISTCNGSTEIKDSINSSNQISFYKLEIYVDTDRKQISGHSEIYFKDFKSSNPIILDLDTALSICEIKAVTGIPIPYERNGNKVLIKNVDLSNNTQFTDSLSYLSIKYSGKPRVSGNPPWESGFVWQTDSLKHPFVGVCSQLGGSGLWMPCIDTWAHKFDSAQITIIAPDGLVGVSNGRLKTIEHIDSVTRYTWLITYPILPYLVTFYLADYSHLDTVFYGDTMFDVGFYINKGHENISRTHFSQLWLILRTYESLFGPYPFPASGLKIVEAPYLGMENQTAIGYGNHFKEGYMGFNVSGIDFHYDFVLLHELSHEWWGNSVSVTSPNDLWINEGLATYCEALFVERNMGYKLSQEYINYDLDYLIQSQSPLCDTIGKLQYNISLYHKGSAVFNTLRHIVDNDSLWFSFFKDIQQQFRYRSINTQTLQSFCMQYFNRDLNGFFNQYVYSADIPVLLLKVDPDNSHKIYYKWKRIIPGFILPLSFVSSGIKITLLPTNEWQSVSIDESIDELAAAIRSEYLLRIINSKN